MKNHTKGYITSWLRENYLIYLGRDGTDYAYVCKLCSMSLFLQDTGCDHFFEKHREWYDFPWIDYFYSYTSKERMTAEWGKAAEEKRAIKEKRAIEKRARVEKPLRRVHLKPWRDPESLFCDTEFLEKLVCKKLVKGDEYTTWKEMIEAGWRVD